MTDSLVLTETDNGITVVTLNRPEALNALSRALRGAIVETFERLRNDAATEVDHPDRRGSRVHGRHST